MGYAYIKEENVADIIVVMFSNRFSQARGAASLCQSAFPIRELIQSTTSTQIYQQ